MPSKTISIVSILTVLAISAFGFQNCQGGSSSPAGDLEVTGSGDDDLISRPTAYVNTGDGSCSEPPKSRIQIDTATGTAEIVRENCADIAATAVDIAALEILPHNYSNLAYDLRVYDAVSDGPGYTEVFCRGRAEDTASDTKWVADAVIHNPDTLPLTGRLAIGAYNLTTGKLEAKYESTYLPVATPKATGGEQRFVHQPLPDEPEEYLLKVRLGDLKGSISYTAAPGAPAPPAALENIELQCYRQ